MLTCFYGQKASSYSCTGHRYNHSLSLSLEQAVLAPSEKAHSVVIGQLLRECRKCHTPYYNQCLVPEAAWNYVVSCCSNNAIVSTLHISPHSTPCLILKHWQNHPIYSIHLTSQVFSNHHQTTNLNLASNEPQCSHCLSQISRLHHTMQGQLHFKWSPKLHKRWHRS